MILFPRKDLLDASYVGPSLENMHYFDGKISGGDHDVNLVINSRKYGLEGRLTIQGSAGQSPKIYNIERLDRYEHVPLKDSDTMLVLYRDIDIRPEAIADLMSHWKCQNGHNHNLTAVEDDEDEGIDMPDFHHRFTKRDGGGTSRICRIGIVGDASFLAGHGNNPDAARARIMTVLNSVDDQYRRTLGIRFSIVRIHIMGTPSNGINDEMLRIRSGGRADHSLRALRQFVRQNPAFQNLCLVHLFTYNSFRDDILGLAKRPGVCKKDGLNTGLTSGRSSGRQVPLRSMMATTAHVSLILYQWL